MSTGLLALTLIHTLISLVGIFTGLIVVAGMLSSRRLERWTTWFLATTIATSVSGYLFPFEHLLPSHIVGALSLVVLAVSLIALYQRRLAGPWRWVYVASATTALYFNVFVLVVQLFLKVPFIHALAPTQAEPPFAIVQGAVLVLFVGLGALAAIRSRPAAMA